MDSDCLQVDWSADNTHFVFGHLNTNFLGTIGKQLIPISGNFLGWVDATHYMFLAPEDNILVGEIANEEIKSYDPGISLPKGFYRYSLTFVILADKAER